MEPYPAADIAKFDQAMTHNRRQVIRAALKVRDRVHAVGDMQTVNEMYADLRTNGSTREGRDTQLITAMVMLAEVLIWIDDTEATE